MSQLESAKAETLEMDLDSILNPGSDSVMLPSGEEKKPNPFSSKPVDLSFLDKAEEEEEEEDPKEPEGKVVDKTEIDDLLKPEGDEPVTPKKGRPAVTKDGMLHLTNKLIEKKMLVPFDDDKPLEEYTLQDFEELFEANIQERERKVREEVPNEFFEALPKELQYAMHYVSNGGTDMKSLFRSLAAVEEVRQMNPKDENDARVIVRSYLQATNFGSPEEIEEEIDAWDDRGELNSKAQKFKPKLDAMTEQQVKYKLAEQERIQKMQYEQARAYTENVYRTLEPGELNGLKLDKKIQQFLFSGLVEPGYTSAATGKQTNLLGHLLEKHQFIEPNHGLIAEALWLLADPDGYKARVRENVKKEVVKDTVRQLKSEESRKNTPGREEEEDTRTSGRKPGIPRPNKSFWSRS